MVSLRYGKEYRMDSETLPDGRNKRRMIYTGPLFYYADEEVKHNRQRIILLFSAVVMSILFVLGFSYYSDISRVWYTSIPYACNAIIAYLYLESICYFWKYREDLNREQKQKGGERFKSLSLVSGLLWMLSFAGGVTSILSGVISPVTVMDGSYLVIVFLELALAIFIFIYSRKIGYNEKANPNADYGKEG